MDNIAGSLGAAPIWRNLMEKYLMGSPIEQFEKPTFVVSKLVCAPGKYTGHDEFFIAGTEPEGCNAPTSFPTVTRAPSLSPSPSAAQNQPTTTPAPTAIQVNQPSVTPVINPTGQTSLPTVVPTLNQ